MTWSSILSPTYRKVDQPVTWRDRAITAPIQLLFKLRGRIPYLGRDALQPITKTYVHLGTKS